LQYEFNSLETSVIDFVPHSPDIIGEYQTSLSMNYSKINLQAGIKYRILESHFNIGADILLAYIIENNFLVTEKILGPPELPPFNTIPPSYKREIIAGEMRTINKFKIQPSFSIGYDMQLARGTYIEPNISFTPSTHTMFYGDKVNYYAIIFGIKFLTAF
jgi:hypothetical protein